METKVCQNCKKDFAIEPEDFVFYEKMKVPPPTFCSECRLVRRMSFRNERTLYKRKCQALGHNEEMISTFSPDKPDIVYCYKSWSGDSWDGIEYGRDYNFSKPFFTQMRELWKSVPDVGLFNINPVNSDYCSITEGNKNCYLVIGGDFNEDSLYSSFIFNSKECMDCLLASKSEKSYELTDCISCFNLKYSRYCETCYDSAFLFNCRNCHDCFGCVNLVNKEYCIFNEQYTKEEYQNKMTKINLGSFKEIEKTQKEFNEFALKFPRRFAKIVKSVDVAGDFIENSKKCTNCFSVFGGAEDSKHLWLIYSQVKDSYDIDHSGLNSIECYEGSSVYPGNQVMFSRFVYEVHHVEYSYNCSNSSYLFGCVGLKNKKYCIFNKQYEPEEWKKLRDKIVTHMKEMPYVDRKGRVYNYGEFFPMELSPFAYNETVANEINPLSKKEITDLGFNYKEDTERHYEIDRTPETLPDDIKDVDGAILKSVIGCEHNGQCKEQCTKAFKITDSELAYYKNYNIPLPRLCSNCRYAKRLSQKNPLHLWHRKCMCDKKHSNHDRKCEVEFETSYAPNKPEIVYCEKCYQQEVY
ncbi:MAG: hypothetical protein ABIS26_01865 [Candidatus Paceibacterota bacterium]